ncbi:MAG: hypothetical protein DI536_04380 [Archangium gephyra]|uniref:Tyr recombinase domain-containing protein n=1 Tax=Archangium gephyra TaxID=48 RepID=A0A2W5TU39_9BACT|nr:MAG: hypothetical protein DI536_04380 [Archangium gephyra]
MSDQPGMKALFTGWGEPASHRNESMDERPPESEVVMGKLEAPRAASAFEVGGIDVQQLALALAEQLKPPEVERPMLGELADAWFEHIAPKRVAPGNEAALLDKLKPLFLDDENTLTVSAINELFEQLLADGYSPTTVNKVRGAGRHVVDFAIAGRRWHGPNPFGICRRKREVRRTYDLLTLEELARVQEHIPSHRRGMFRVALHLGLRTGELLALQKSDVDFEAGIVTIERSHNRDTTKTGTTRVVPMHPAIAGDLLEASLASPSELIFPNEGGDLQRHDTKLTRILRTAMAAAGVGVTSVEYKCRRRWCEEKPHTRDATAVEDVDCPSCGMRMWPVPEVRPVRWYDLRHMNATLHHEHGADEICIAKALGHSLKGTTRAIYIHPDIAMMRAQLTKWRLD